MSWGIWQWFLVYLGAGVALVVIGRALVKRFYKGRQTALVRECLAALERPRSPSQQRREVVSQAAVGVLAILVWPLAAVALAWDARARRQAWREPHDAPAFLCSKQDLLEIVNALEVEAGASVVDPLGRVPDLPFGHLNPGWKRLRAQFRPGDVLWRFRTEGTGGTTAVVHGYALLRGGRVAAEFITEWG